jgi:hypothetical protein
MIVVWPSTVIHSVRIGNDDLVYLFFGGSFYFTTRWWFQKREIDLSLAAVTSALGVVTKVNALVLFAILGLLILFRLAVVEKERRPSAYLKRGALTVGLALASFAIALGSAVRESLAGSRPSVLIGNSESVTSALTVGNRAENYLWLDVPNFVNRPFTSPWDDAFGRQWFWNYLFKTGLFGEFHFDSPLVWNLAVCISIAFLGILAYAIGGALVRGFVLDWLPVTLTMALITASIAALRIRHPQASSNDFRYVLPVLTPFLLVYVRSVMTCWERGWVRVAKWGAALGWIFAALSIVFILAIAGTKNP